VTCFSFDLMSMSSDDIKIILLSSIILVFFFKNTEHYKPKCSTYSRKITDLITINTSSNFHLANYTQHFTQMFFFINH